MYMEFPLKKLFFVVVFISSLFSPTVFAEVKIGFVNSIQVMEAAPQVEAANKRLEQEFAPRHQDIEKQQRAIKSLEEQLAKDAAIMKESESRKLEYDIVSKKRDLKRQQEEFREDYNIRRNEELDKLQKEIIKIIQSVAKEDAYDLILNIEGVIWASEKVDITSRVLKRLTQENRGR